MKLPCVLILFVGFVGAYKSGAPTASCVSMTPGHGVAAQTTKSPYTLKITNNGTVVNVVISGSEEFKGFVLQARNINRTAVGTFKSSDPLVQVIDCMGSKQNAVTHTSDAKKTSVNVVWMPPNPHTSVNFTLTTVKNFSTFWVGQTVFWNASAMAHDELEGLPAMGDSFASATADTKVKNTASATTLVSSTLQIATLFSLYLTRCH